MEIGDNQKFNTSIDRNLDDNGYSMPIFSRVIGRELSHDSSTNIYLRCRGNLTRNSVGTESPYFMHLGIPAVHVLDELRSFGTPDTRFVRPADGPNWSTPGCVFGKATVVTVSGTRSEKNYSSKTDFGTRRENQYFERQNISMS